MAKQEEIVSMFNDIAPSYDLSNRVISFGVDVLWRKEACEVALDYHRNNTKRADKTLSSEGQSADEQKPTCHSVARQIGEHEKELASLSAIRNREHINILDLACGSGDMVKAWHSVLGQNRLLNYHIQGIDPSSQMLDIARNKFQDEGISFDEAYANNIPVSDNSVDVISISFGIRNVVNLQEAFREFQRILKPGGILLILEFFKDDKKHIPARLRNFYIKKVLPKIGGWLSKNREAYQYLADSIEGFLTTQEMQKMLMESGLETTYLKGFFLDIAHCMVLKKVASPKHLSLPKVKINKDNKSYQRALKTVGMKCFITYFELFSDEEIESSDIVAKMMKEEKYTKESCQSKISNARFIIKNGYTKTALEQIQTATRVDEKIRRKAKRLLKKDE